MTPAAVAAIARQIGDGEPVAIVDLAAVDHNCRSAAGLELRQHEIAWRPAYKTLRSPGLLAYVLAKLDRPRVMIHHLRDLPQALPHVPAGTDFLMGYPPTLGELRHYLRSRPARGERRHKLRINVDGIELLRALDELSKHTPRKLPIDVVLEIYNGIPRGGFDPGAELTEALEAAARRAAPAAPERAALLRRARRREPAMPATRQTAAKFAQGNLTRRTSPSSHQAHDLVDLKTFVRNGPGSSNYPYWAGTTAANEFSAGLGRPVRQLPRSLRHLGGAGQGAVPVRAGAAAAGEPVPRQGPVPDPARDRAGVHQVGRLADRQQPDAFEARLPAGPARGAGLRPRLQRLRPDPRAQRSSSSSATTWSRPPSR